MKKHTPKLIQFRQGDVLVERVNKIPGGVEQPKENGRVILAHGEVTGHAHELAEPRTSRLLAPAQPFKLPGDLSDSEAMTRLLLEVGDDTSLIHQEHATIPVEEGSYRVVRQREYSPEAIRNVAD